MACLNFAHPQNKVKNNTGFQPTLSADFLHKERGAGWKPLNGFFIKNKKLKNNRHSALDAESAGRKSAIPSGSYCLASCQAITDSASSAE